MGDLTLKQAAAMCGGQVDTAFEHLTFSGACMDTREIQRGQLFVALTGETRDGHDYASQAMGKGAAAVLAQRPLDRAIPAIYVPDTLRALGEIARDYRLANPIRVVGITGSVGKTTTKEMTAAILESTFTTGKTDRNFNNQIGLPLSILNLHQDSQTAVLEMGMNHKGEISYLTAIARPDIAVITNIGTMHMEYLGSRETILQAKLEILEGLRAGGTAIFNGDDALLWGQRHALRIEPVYFGLDNPACQVRASHVEQLENATRFQVEGFGKQLTVTLPEEGRHLVYDALAAITVGLCMDVAPDRIEQALANYENTGLRQKIYEAKGFTIIADCYNAGPESMDAALSVLAGRKCQGRRIAVLGDMLELGTHTQAEHYRIGRLVAARADMLYTYGLQGARIALGAITGGMDKRNMGIYHSREELAADLRRTAKPGDVLLFKGSRGMKMEQVLDLFLQD